MNVLILAGGFGTRLYPLTKNIPKALIKIKKKPVLEHILNKIKKLEEIENIYLLSNNKFYIDFLEWLNKYKKENRLGEKIKIINNGVREEKRKKGAVKDLLHGLNVSNGSDVLVLASDNLFDFDLNELINLSYKKQKSAVALKQIKNLDLIKKYSCVLLDEENKISFFQEKPEYPRSNIISTFIYLLKKQDIDILKKNEKDLEKFKNIIHYLYTESDIYGKIFNENWLDIGSFEQLEKANL